MFVANEMMIAMNLSLYNWLDRLEIRATDPVMKDSRPGIEQGVRCSGIRGNVHGPDGISMERGAESRPSPAVQRVVGSRASQELRDYYFAHYEKKDGSRPIADIVITNELGAVIAASGVAGRYRLNDDPLRGRQRKPAAPLRVTWYRTRRVDPALFPWRSRSPTRMVHSSA